MLHFWVTYGKEYLSKYDKRKLEPSQGVLILPLPPGKDQDHNRCVANLGLKQLVKTVLYTEGLLAVLQQLLI